MYIITVSYLLKCNMETWKDIPWYEGLYSVSDKWNVKRLSNKKEMREKILSPSHVFGYKQIQLFQNGVPKCVRVHRLVCMAFLPNIYNKTHINHKNGIRDDNRLENLEWCTPRENAEHKYRTLWYINSDKQRKMSKEVNSKSVQQITIDWEIVRNFNSTLEAQKETGIQNSSISQVCNGKRWTAWGFKWKYITK